MKTAEEVTLSDTAVLMASQDYKRRFMGEYVQAKIRLEKLTRFNNSIEAHELAYSTGSYIASPKPRYDCPRDILIQQQEILREYVHVLEVRAIFENIDLSSENIIEAVKDEAVK